MREPRPGLAWSRQRVRRRATYAAWMASVEWLAQRRRWWVAWVAAHGAEPTCVACGAPWTLRHGDLHHRSYDRLGHERPDDVSAMCRACHGLLHAILESSPAWRQMDRAQASDLIVARLRRDACTKGVEDGRRR
jgi:hypothetical protein